MSLSSNPTNNQALMSAFQVVGGGLQDLGGFSGGGHMEAAQKMSQVFRQQRAAQGLSQALQSGVDPQKAITDFTAAGGDIETANAIMGMQDKLQYHKALGALGNYISGSPQTPQGGPQTPQGGIPTPQGQPGAAPMMPTPQQQIDMQMPGGMPMPQMPQGMPGAPGGAPGPQGLGGGFGNLPPELLQSLVKSGVIPPEALLNQFMPKAPIKLGKDDRLIEQGTNKELVGAAPHAPDQWKVNQGQDEITYQLNAQGQPVEVGRAPRSAMEAAKSPERQAQDLAAAAARRERTPGDKPPVGYRLSTDGNLEFIPGGPADPAKGAGRKAPTEDQAKNLQLYGRASQQLPIVLKNFDALSSMGNQAAGALHPSLASGEYQEASNALTDIAASYLYSVSGATASPGEVKNLVSTVTPRVGESSKSVADKKARIQQMVDSIRVRANGGQEGGPAQAASGKPSQIKTDADFNALPSGTEFIAPDGSHRRKP